MSMLQLSSQIARNIACKHPSWTVSHVMCCAPFSLCQTHNNQLIAAIRAGMLHGYTSYASQLACAAIGMKISMDLVLTLMSLRQDWDGRPELICQVYRAY